MAQYDLNLRDSWLVVKKRKLIIIFTVFAMGLFSLVFAILGKPVPLYRASSSIKIEKTSSVTGLYVQAISWSQTDDMETQAAVIKSYYVIEMVARKLGLIPEELSSDEVRANNEYLGIILDLKDSVETEQEGYSNIINIIVTSGDPGFTQRLANTIARVYKEERIRDLNKRTVEARKFIENQLKIVKERLKRSEEAVRNFREENKLISLSAQTSAMLGEVAKLQATYEKLLSDNEKIKIVEQYLEKAKNKPLTSKTSFYINEASSLYKSLNDKLVQLMLKRDSLLLTYTENFPEVVEINRQIREIASSMQAQLSSQGKVVEETARVLKKKIDEMDERIKMLPEKGLQLARLERDVSVNMEVYTLLETKYQEALIKEAEKVEEVQIVKPALEPTTPVNPPKTGATATVGTIIGLILGIVFAFIIETFDTSIGAIEEVESLLGVPVLGIIPYVGVQEMKATLEEKYPEGLEEGMVERYARLVSHFASESVLAESFRALRTNLKFTSLEKDIKTVVFTSSSPREGKTSSVVNLAITMAQGGNKVLLVEGDLRKPVISRMFGLDQSPGLTDVILGNYKWRDVIRTVTDIMMGKMGMDDIMRTPGIDNLHIMACGTIPPNPAELTGSKGISEFIRDARSEYDMVLIDAPPVLAATDAAILGSGADGVIIVYQVGKVSRITLKRAKAQLDNVRANVIGVILNGLQAEISPDFSGYDYYKQYYSYKEKEEQKKTFWDKLLSIPGSIIAFFGRAFEKRPEGENVDEGRSKLKIFVLLAALLFLIIAVLYQTGYLRLPGSMPRLFINQSSDISVEDNVVETKTVKERIGKNLPMLPVEAEPGAQPEDEAAKTEVVKKKIEKNLLTLPSGEVEPGAQPEDNTAEKNAVKEKIEKNLPMLPSGEAEPGAQPEDNTAKTEVAKKEIAKNLTNLPSGEAKPGTEQTEKIVANNKPYAIQIKAGRDPERVKKFVAILKKKGVDAHWARVNIEGKGVWYRVFIGHFANNKDAVKYMREKGINKSYPGSWVVMSAPKD